MIPSRGNSQDKNFAGVCQPRRRLTSYLVWRIRSVEEVFITILSPLHNPHETKAMVELVAKHSPKVIMEIGTCAGGTLFAWCRHISSMLL